MEKRNARPRINLKFAWYRLEIKRSKIHSWGVFASEDIPRGKPIIEYTGKPISYAEGSLLDPPEDAYLVRVAMDTMLDGSRGGSGAQHVNHSCNPNLYWKRFSGRLVFYSRRRIRAGEELTFLYSYPSKITRIPCHCGSPKCRKTLRYLLA